MTNYVIYTWTKVATLAILILVSITNSLATGPTQQPSTRFDYGLATAKRANCMGCHQWHGRGGPSYGGAAISLRTTQLTQAQIVQVIKCGRPGTNMPYFDQNAYGDLLCYDMTFEDFGENADNRPLQGKLYLNDRQVKAVASFVVETLQGQTVTKDYCEKFFGGTARQCDSLE